MRLVSLLIITTALTAATYEVGPGKPYATPLSLPWNLFADGDTVKIYYQSIPYKTQLYVGWSNFTISCIAGPNGEMPIIDGDGAVASAKVTFYNLDRGLVRVGESSSPPSKLLENVTIEGCEFRNVNHLGLGYRLESWSPGYYQPWADNGAAIQATGVKNFIVRNNYIHDNLVGTSAFSAYPTRVSENCQILNNIYVNHGGVGDSQNHVTYTECNGETYQGNYVTQPANWSSVFKSRGAKTHIISNYIYGGDAMADLVDSQNMRNIVGNDDPDIFANNFITKVSGYDNDRYIHFGGDSGFYSGYRKNTLYVANNTVYAQRNGNVLVRASSWHQTIVLVNNVIQWAFLPTYGFYLALETTFGPLGEKSNLSYQNNWFQKGSCPYVDYPMQYCGLVGNLTSSDLGSNTWAVSTGIGNIPPTSTPQWNSLYRPLRTSPLINAGIMPTTVITDWTFNGTRQNIGGIDIGAYEYPTIGNLNQQVSLFGQISQIGQPFPETITFALGELCDYPNPYSTGSSAVQWRMTITERWPSDSRCAGGSAKTANVLYRSNSNTTNTNHLLWLRAFPGVAGNLTFVVNAPSGQQCSYYIGATPPESVDASGEPTIAAGALARVVKLEGQSAGTKYLRVTCGDTARTPTITFTQN